MFCKAGKGVFLVEILDKIAPEHEEYARTTLLAKLKKANAEIHTGCRAEEIRDDVVICRYNDGKVVRYPAETVVIAVGLYVRKMEAEQLFGIADQTFVIGDGKEARKYTIVPTKHGGPYLAYDSFAFCRVFYKLKSVFGFS